MKNLIKNLMYIGLFSMALVFNSCQEEFEEINGGDSQETIVANSTTATLIENTSANDGSFDNIVDGASCFAINFPYTIEIAGVQITIDSIEDLNLIEAIFDEFEDDEDVLELIFPITITLDDFTEITIENKEALRELVEECTGGTDDDIECIDFVYPIVLFTFDVNEQQTGRVEINSDRELRRFFAGLEDDDIISIDFPITLVRFDGVEVVVNSNTELAAALERAKNECDEDDDNDFNDDDFTIERLDALLVECPWLVREVRRNNVDQTEQYFEFLMNFDEDGTVVVNDRGGNMLTGSWNTSSSERGVLLNLDFETLVDFNLQWLVYDIGDGRIKLFGDDTNRIILKQFCENEGDDDCNREVVANYLENCRWEILDTNLGINFEGRIDFSNRNIHAFNANEEVVDEGNWEITETGFRFNNLFAEILPLGGDWTIAFCSDLRIKLENEEGKFVILVIDCEDDSKATPDTLREILKECEWVIRRVKNQGEEINRLLGFEFEFMPEGVVTLSNSLTTSQGTWEVGLNDDEVPALLITLGEEGAVSFDWPLRDLDDERLVFEVEEVGYELALQRVCDDNTDDEDVTGIRNTILGGQWNVRSYVAPDGLDNAGQFEGIDFSFSNMNQVEVSENDDPFLTGLWRILRNRDDNLKFYLNLSDRPFYDELTEAWDIVSVNDERIELIYEGENETKVLVFEKRI